MKGLVGDDPPYHCPGFVLSHHARGPIEIQGGTVFHFVSEGIQQARRRARAAGRVEHEGQNAPKELTELQLKERSTKRLPTPEDLMGTLVFFCSPDSDFMTGRTIVVDGGSVFH